MLRRSSARNRFTERSDLSFISNPMYPPAVIHRTSEVLSPIPTTAVFINAVVIFIDWRKIADITSFGTFRIDLTF